MHNHTYVTTGLGFRRWGIWAVVWEYDLQFRSWRSDTTILLGFTLPSCWVLLRNMHHGQDEYSSSRHLEFGHESKKGLLRCNSGDLAEIILSPSIFHLYFVLLYKYSFSAFNWPKLYFKITVIHCLLYSALHVTLSNNHVTQHL